MEDSRPGVLIVDDDADVLLAARMALRDRFGQVATAQNPSEIPALLAARPFAAILLDMNYSRGSTSGAEGFAWLDRIHAEHPSIAVVIITAHGGVQIAVEAIKRGATDFVTKPWANERFIATVTSAVELGRSRMKAASAEQRALVATQSPGGDTTMLGASPAMQHVRALIERAAPTDASVLILGENGTGKEVVARELHRLSRRAERIFVSVDLGSVTPTLFESELFGHKRGAFTDAKADRIGRFEAADGGTLFLDEVGNLPLHLQPKLLTALEQRKVTPVGGNSPVGVDVRVIAATNAGPDKLNDEGFFRQDLLFRLNTVEIHLPPLRQRREDIPALVAHFLAQYARKYERGTLHVPDDVMAALAAHDWPGNVRALRHAVERAVIMAQGAALSTADFALSVPVAAAPMVESARVLSTEDLNLDRAEKQMIERALSRHSWNISLAAKELGLTRASLYRRMEKHGL